MATGLVFEERFLEHDTGAMHPERPERLAAIRARLHSTGLWDRLEHIRARPADTVDIQAVHDPAYVRRVREACESRARYIDVPDSAICPDSYEVAMLAAGGVLAATEAVIARRVDNAFCAVRPPGHHAEPDRSMGFCLFCNVAVAADAAVRRMGLERVAVVDFDVHPGPGTQHIFEQRGDVLFVSIHEHPSYLYPGTGFAWEKGSGEGEGATLNVPLDPQSDDEAYRAVMIRQVLPALEAFAPQMLFISAGFDASEFDPLAHMKVSAEGFAWISRRLKALADERCGGRLLSVLEGGYDLRSLAECVCGHVSALMEANEGDDLMAMKAGF